MKIMIVGANGTIGQYVTKALSGQHDIITIGTRSGDYHMDMSDPQAIADTLAAVGHFDALICTAGSVAFAPLTQLTTEKWAVGLNGKLMGQINLATLALTHLNANGSITLTTGIISDHPIVTGTSAATINGALEHFVKAAATELPNGIRINAVSPAMLEDSAAAYGPYFPGFHAVSGQGVAMAYIRSVMGVETGQTFKVFGKN